MYNPTYFDRHHMREGPLQVSSRQLVIGTWNVEGLTDEKIISLRLHMRKMKIDILCIQETHKSGSDYVTLDDGSLLILSGKPDTDSREYAGVGFIVSPHMKKSLIGFCKTSTLLRLPGFDRGSIQEGP